MIAAILGEIAISSIISITFTSSPFAYRGYIFDIETGLYYCQSRYYSPSWGRFITADDPAILEVTMGNVHGANLFSYCNNDPINYVDYTGLLRVNIKWVDVTLDVLLKVISPMVGSINSALAKAGKRHSKLLLQITDFFSKYYNKIANCITDAISNFVNKNLATSIASIVCNSVFKALTMISVLSSIGNIIEYVIDCLDGSWDGYIDTSKKLKFRIIWRQAY